MDSAKALEFHELTKHSYFSVRTGFHRLDWANKPHPFKTYLDTPKIPLPKDIPKPEKPVFASFTPQTGSKMALDMKTLASILFFTGGITRAVKYFDGVHYFRAAPATGALYPIELYVVAGDVEGLSPGVYHFDPKTFSLNVLRRGDYRSFLARYSHPSVSESSAAVVFTSIPWRNAWKYRERSYRHWFWDSGVMVANMFACCNAFGLKSFFAAGFVDEKVNDLVGVDGVKEAAIIVASIGSSEKTPETVETVEPINPATLPLSRRETRYPAVEEIHKASSLKSVDELAEWRRAAENPLAETATQVSVEGPPLWEVILRRGSTRKFSRTSIGLDAFTSLCRTASVNVPTDFGSYTAYFIIVNAVENTAPGAYRYSGGQLVPLKKGEFRRISGFLCLEQELGEDGSAVFFIMTPLMEILGKMGNRGYRVAQLDGGIKAGLLYLASYGLGIGATGLTFYDDDVTQFFSLGSSGMENVIVVAVGNPAYRARPGGMFLGIDE
ncbi:MAG: SagB/ThcOx family dehydrogenase [Candidatus Caldarchaeum sp.]|nr:SagB/ThcOx family dehydrogenase [Candidatus Caldarchaeum sp.]